MFVTERRRERTCVLMRARVRACVCVSVWPGWARVYTDGEDPGCMAAWALVLSMNLKAFHYAFSLHASTFPFLFGWKSWVLKTLLN